MQEYTMFAPAPRAPGEAVAKQRASVSSFEHIRMMMDSLPSLAGIINHERQFVLVNERLLEALEMGDIEDVIGKRPGEALACVHAFELSGGCGTSEHCRYCGAVQAILESQKTRSRVCRECRITCVKDGVEMAMDLLVTASHCVLSGLDYTILTIFDIGAEKRRSALERVFFHDIINTATTLYTLIDGIETGVMDAGEEWPRLKRLSYSLLDDIEAQQDLAAAERGELSVRREYVDARALLEEVVIQMESASAINEKKIIVDPASATALVLTDGRLLRRTLFNMLKNALEAVPPASEVRAGTEVSGERVRYWVKNDTVMPPEVQASVFQRSFSTKGPGRGLGTYSMRLLGERYLGGTVWFESSGEAGTTFSAEFPIEPGE